MKKYISIIMFSLLIVSCEKNVIGDFEPSPYLGTDLETPADLSKKGVAFTNRSKDWSHKTSALKAHWMYSWGNVLREEIPENVEFVPMFWGKGSVKDENIDRIKQLVADGKVKYVLGFNEPDGAAQANMTVDEAIALWPRLEEIGVPLVSPAPVAYNNAWMTEFMQKVDELGLRVDYIAIHSYGGANALNFINTLKAAHELYNRPLWITEFAVADWNATTPENNKYSEAQVIEFMQDATSAMNTIEWVHRYAWFDGSNAALAPSSLFDDEANITQLGEVYAAINANEAIGPGQDTEIVVEVNPDELIVNGGFETGDTSGWYSSGAAFSTSTNNPYEGTRRGNMGNEFCSIKQDITVAPNFEYIVDFWWRFNNDATTPAYVSIRDNANNDAIYTETLAAQTTEWTNVTFTFTSTVENVRFQLYKDNRNAVSPTSVNNSIAIDNVSIKLK